MNDHVYKTTKADIIRNGAFLPVEVRKELLKGEIELPTFKNEYGVVLFVDISGFTKLGQKYRELYDEKEATDRLSRDIMQILETLTRICLEWGGDVAKFAGDALICLWKVEPEDYETGLRYARRAAYDMMIAVASSDGDLDLHGGIGYGSMLHFYLGSEDMRWYLVSGVASVDAAARLDESEKGMILYPKTKGWDEDAGSMESLNLSDEMSAYTVDFPLDRNDRAITTSSDCSDENIFAQHKPPQQMKLSDWADRMSLDDIRSYIPQKVTKKLEGGAIDAGEIHSGVCTMFVALDYLMLAQTELYSNRVATEKLQDLNEVFLTLTKLVHLYNGEVRDLLFDDKGCVFIAVFGAHNSEEMTQLKAVQAGMDISRGFSRSRIGISVGDSFVGMCGTAERHDFIVMGHDVNLAARFMGNAKPGEIIVSPTIRNTTNSYLQYQEHRFVKKGVEFECFKLKTENLHAKSVPFMSYADMNPVFHGTRFIGRIDEEYALKNAKDQGKNVLVFGREGVGKSSFLRHIGSELSEQEGLKVYHAEAFALEESSTYYVARQVVESILNAETGIDCRNVQKRRRIRDPALMKLKELGVKINGYALKYLLPNVKTLLNGNSKSVVMKRRDPKFRKSEVVKKVSLDTGLEKGVEKMILKFMLQLLQKMGDCVIIIDDIHWSDIDSLKVLIKLMNSDEIPDVRFIMSTRPLPKLPSQKRDRHERLRRIMSAFHSDPNCSFIHLENLNQQDSSEYAEQVLHSLEGWGPRDQVYPVDLEVLDALMTRTRGDPTHLNSLVCWLWENQYIGLREGEYSFLSDAAQEMAHTHVPGDVAQSVRARLDELPGKAQKLLKIAAAIGKVFSLGTLERMAKADAFSDVSHEGSDKDSLKNGEVVQSTLETLQDYGFIEHSGDSKRITRGAVKPRVQFRIARLYGKNDNWKFSVDIVQEVVVSCIPQARLEKLKSLLKFALREI
eukprot:CAMPEP_0184009808 /NCGR_PEP_ID=MMETSP0954-20121128/2830_1 /TAXON_ID=627963 /ORGANISM="Aplanochytrium sp, Strain PBS07" /LENGTH=957 /DNA_ID=CAMNT_0026289261 /DNA_START=339 /DNA_END=3212 /DNA_ORIENTATION=-